MGVSFWFGVLKVLLSLVDNVAGIIRESRLLDAGEARGVAKSMAAAADRLGIGKVLVSEIEAMADADLDAELRGDR